MILTPRTYPLPRALPLTKEPEDSGFSILDWEWSFRIWSGEFQFGVMFSSSEWSFGIRSGVFKFGVAFSNSEWSFRIWSDIFKLEVMFSNSERGFEIRSEVFEFKVKFSHSEWSFGIWSELLQLRVNFYNQEWTLRIRSELLELRWTFRIIIGIWSMFKDKDCHLEFGVHFWAAVGPLVHHALRLLYKHGGSVRTCCCTRHFGAFRFLSGRWLQRTFASIGVFKSYYYKLWGFTRFYRGWHRIGHYMFIERREI